MTRVGQASVSVVGNVEKCDCKSGQGPVNEGV